MVYHVRDLSKLFIKIQPVSLAVSNNILIPLKHRSAYSNSWRRVVLLPRAFCCKCWSKKTFGWVRGRGTKIYYTAYYEHNKGAFTTYSSPKQPASVHRNNK